MSGVPCAAYVAARNPWGIALCRTPGQPGAPCPNTPRHVEPACPRCGRWPGGWHERAVCPPPDAREGPKGCGYDPRKEVARG